MLARRSFLLSTAAFVALPKSALAAWRKHGGIYLDTWIALDGRLAPGGTTPYPNLLDNYVASGSPRRERAIGTSYKVTDTGRRQPPWMVAGVDYGVGPQTGTVQRVVSSAGAYSSDFQTFLTNNGGSGTFASRSIKFTGQQDLVIELWDFTTDGGFIITLSNCQRTTIRNCIFGGSNYLDFFTTGYSIIQFENASGSSGLRLEYCTLDGSMTQINYVSNQQGLLQNDCGTWPSVIQYNWLKNSAQLGVSNTGYPGPGTSTYQYNLVDEVYAGINVFGLINAVNNNGGAFQIQTTTAQVWTTGRTICISGVVGTGGMTAAINTTASTTWTVTRDSSTLFTLQGSTFVGAYTSGGRAGDATSQNKHMNYSQNNPSRYVLNIQFNTTKQTVPGGAEGFQLASSPTNIAVTNVTDNGGGFSRVTVGTSESTWATGTLINFNSVAGTGSVPNVNGEHAVTKINNTTFDLLDVAFTGGSAFSSGGTAAEVVQMSARFNNNTMIAQKSGGVNVMSAMVHGPSHSTAATVTGAANNGGGLIRLTTTGLDGNITTGDFVQAKSVGGVPNATGRWNVNLISAGVIDLQGSTFAGTFTSGGKAWDADEVMETPSTVNQNYFDGSGSTNIFYQNPNWNLFDSFAENIDMTTGLTVPMPTPA